ncbi:hypothetical protein POM88_030462 [Heracleum sosnowskyi]|uniref:Thiamine phosphate synthase/TenI domain-containing protein n=1 Tax=Heracleum sosnowskyi TaxID=360622 RepID=A0AAD8MIS2_9APIA|nr:hypothetical protein POM88_030462 [Heracleum sosnowskyi]
MFFWQIYRDQLLPVADIVTPNLKASTLLHGIKLQTVSDMCAAAKSIHNMGPRRLCFIEWPVKTTRAKGGDVPASSYAFDIFFDGMEFYELCKRFTDVASFQGNMILKLANFLQAAKRCLEVFRSHGVPLLINDHIDIALACDADGVHVEQAHEAWVNGADYIGSGGVYSTNTKANNITIGLDGLKTVCLASKLPVVAIRGIGPSNAHAVMELGLENLKGVAVVSALFDRECISSE